MYDYESMKPKLFTEEGFRVLLKVKENADRMSEIAGCATVDKLMSSVTGDSWLMLAAIDFLEEKGYLRKVSSSGATQHHVYRSK